MRNRFEAEKQRRAAAWEKKRGSPGWEPDGWQRDPAWRSQWLGQWVHEASARVYAFDERNIVDGGNVLADPAIVASLLSGRDPQWTYVCGVDLGWKDPTAWALAAWRAADPRL